jgi:hypothetical protein
LPWSYATAIGVVLLLDFLIVATHELTPYVLLQLGALCAVGAMSSRGWETLIAMALITITYLIPNLGYLSDNFGLFQELRPGRQ